jgi:predicted aspartyl protease
MLVPVHHRAGAATLRLVLDSGASDLVLFENGERAAAVDVERDARPAIMTSRAGRRFVRRARIPALKIGDVFVRDVVAALVRLDGEQRSRREDGLLPVRLFSSIQVNSREGLLVLRR